MRRDFLFRGSKACQREEVQERAKVLADSLPKYKGKAFVRMKPNSIATHWAIESESGFELFALYWDEYSFEHVLIRDGNTYPISKEEKGYPVILEDSILWWNYALTVWENEWRKTPEYAQMMKESMEAVRRAERED